jgi:tryptophan-rich sensory protein
MNTTRSVSVPHIVLAALIVLLLVIAASRSLRWAGLVMNPDEVWSVWQSVGTPLEIIQRTPYDWPPGYFLIMGGWQALVGSQPLLMRAPGLFALLIGCAALYRAGRRLSRQHTGGMLCALGFAGLGMVMQIGLEVRGYSMLLALYPLAFWFTLRYFQQPGWGRALLLAVTLAACFYISVTAIVLILALGLYTLFTMPRRIWRWVVPGAGALLLALPDLVNKLGVAGGRSTNPITAPIPEAFGQLWWAYLGDGWPVWVALFIIAGIGAVRAWHADQRATGLALLLVIGLMPPLLYLFNPLLGFFSGRYSSAVLLLIALAVGVGVASYPRPIRLGVLVLLGMLLVLPVPERGEYRIFGVGSPLQANLEWLRGQLVPGDVLMLDPANSCGKAEEWDYHLRNSFPTGLTFVTDAAGHRRVWYVARDVIPEAVQAGRLPGRFVGPPGCLFRLFESPPDPVGILYANGMRFHGADILEGELPWTGPVVRREGESIRLRLWWSADRPVDRDYSIGLYVLGRGVFAQVDGTPQITNPAGAPTETSRWQPGQLYAEERTLTLPTFTPRTRYPLWMAIYYWADGARVAGPGLTEERLRLLRLFDVMSY